MRDRLAVMAQRLGRKRIERVKRILAIPIRSRLDLLATLYGSDKAPAAHNYTAVYCRHLPRRRAVRRVLEIGIGGYERPDIGGQSLRMWRDYFPRAHITGIDIHYKEISEARVTTIVADQGDVHDLNKVARLGPFDVIVDDGSHIGRHTLQCFEVLFPALTTGGLYVLEDVHTSYLPAYEGGTPGTVGTAVDLAKSLLDHLHLRDDVNEIHAYRSIVFISKGAPVTQSLEESVLPGTPELPQI